MSLTAPFSGPGESAHVVSAPSCVRQGDKTSTEALPGVDNKSIDRKSLDEASLGIVAKLALIAPIVPPWGPCVFFSISGHSSLHF